MESTTTSGLTVVERVKPRIDATTMVGTELVEPNGNEPPGTVGPDNVDPGMFVMYPWNRPPPEAQNWSGWPVGWQPPMWNGYNPINQLIGRVATAWNALDLNASTLGAMPAYVTKGTTPQPAPTWLTNPQPEVYTSWYDFAKQLFMAFQMGEAFVWATARYQNSYPSAFVCLRSDWVNIDFVDGVRRYNLGGLDITADVLHIRYFTVPGNAHGVGPLEAIAYSLFNAAQLGKFESDLLNTGGIPWSVLQFPDELNAKQVDDIHARWIMARQRAMGAPAVLSGGFELKPLSFNPKELALLDLRTFNESAIAVALGVPPYLMAMTPETGRSITYQNISHILEQHWRLGLNPKAVAVMSALSNWLLPRGTSVELNRDDYIRPPLENLIPVLVQLAGVVDPLTGQQAITVDEIRSMLRLQGEDAVAALTGAPTGSGAPATSNVFAPTALQGGPT